MVGVLAAVVGMKSGDAAIRRGSRAEVEQAFRAWIDQHGYIWFEGDLALAAVLARYLKINVEIDGLAVAGDVEGVTQG